MEIRARASLTDQSGIAGIRIWLDDTGYSASDFAADASGLVEIFAEVPNSGALRIRMELLQGSEVIAEGSFSLPMSDNFEWGMDLFRQAKDPLETCIGCFGAASFPILETAQNEPAEAIWFAWGGRPRGSDIVY